MNKIGSSFHRKSNAYVYHMRGPREKDAAMVRDFQKFCWIEIGFEGRSTADICYELNTKWLTDGRKLIVFNPEDPVEMVQKMKELLRRAGSQFDIKLVSRDEVEEEETTPYLAVV